jgi:hypothetical protein
MTENREFLPPIFVRRSIEVTDAAELDYTGKPASNRGPPGQHTPAEENDHVHTTGREEEKGSMK